MSYILGVVSAHYSIGFTFIKYLSLLVTVHLMDCTVGLLEFGTLMHDSLSLILPIKRLVHGTVHILTVARALKAVSQVLSVNERRLIMLSLLTLGATGVDTLRAKEPNVAHVTGLGHTRLTLLSPIGLLVVGSESTVDVHSARFLMLL